MPPKSGNYEAAPLIPRRHALSLGELAIYALAMGTRKFFRKIATLALVAFLLSPTLPANAAIASKAFITATKAPVRYADKVAFDLDVDKTLYNYTHWWCVSIDNKAPEPNVVKTYLEPWWDTDYRDNIGNRWGNTSDGEIFGQNTCWTSSFFSFSSAGVLTDLSLLPAGNHSLQVSIRGCGDGYSSCALASTELASNLISEIIAIPVAKLVEDQINSDSRYIQEGGYYHIREWLYKKPDVPSVFMKSWCVKIDGKGFTKDLAIGHTVSQWLFNDKTWIDGCVQVPDRDAEQNSDYGMDLYIDAFKLGLGSHTFAFKAELQNGQSISFERVITGTGTIAPRTQPLVAEQRYSDLHLKMGISWPFDKPASAEVEWFVDGTSVIKNSVSTSAEFAETVIPGINLTSGSHEVTAKLTTSAGSVLVEKTSVSIDNRPATVTFSQSLDKTYKTGSTVVISGNFLDAEGFEPKSARIRTKQYGKAWTAWKTIKVTGGYFALSQKILLNTSVQVSADSTWDGATYLGQAEIKVAPVVFKYTESAKRTKLKSFLQGAVVTYKVTTDKTYSGTCVVMLETKYAFNFALVWLGAETKWSSLKIKNGVGTGTVTVKYNGQYSSSILCSAPGYKDVYRSDSNWIFRVTN